MYIKYPIIGKHPSHQAMVDTLNLIANTDDNVLISGETGTGKDLIADAIQRKSSRCQKPYLQLNCSTLAPDLIETELFGRCRHQLTRNKNNSLIAEADGGTLLLDEIDALPASAQIRLLDEIEQSKGKGKPQVRILSITTTNLLRLTEQGKFQKELYQQLSTIHLELQSLKDRKADIPLLLGYYLGAMAKRYDVSCPKISRAVFDQLMAYHWPGNIRELRNICENVVARRLSYIESVAELPIKLDQLEADPSLKQLSVHKSEKKKPRKICLV